jgi:predicted PhzF superfamily epimerase YddE/YHI9
MAMTTALPGGQDAVMELTVVDAFTDRPFSGNPAAVAVVDVFPEPRRMQLIAREMNLSETAFVVRRQDGEHDLRWFTPTTEVDLCGHATLAAAHLVGATAVFNTRSGRLACTGKGELVEMDFPASLPEAGALPFVPAAWPSPLWTGTGGGYALVELPSERDVVALDPDMSEMAGLSAHGVIITAVADSDRAADFVSRVFGPNVGIPEDPVTGSAHCVLGPYWAPRLDRTELTGDQVSARGGQVGVSLDGDRVRLSGRAVTVSRVSLLV